MVVSSVCLPGFAGDNDSALQLQELTVDSLGMTIRKHLRPACLALLYGCVSVSSNVSRATPATGTALLQRMHDAYDGKWYKTLTFVQKTTLTRPNGVVDTSTWYESLKSPDRLRIDFGDPAKGNGALYTADSLYVVRGGKVTRTIASGNPFLPFVAGVYDQPVETTLRQLAPYHFDLSRIRTDTWTLPSDFFVAERWSAVPHWFRGQ